MEEVLENVYVTRDQVLTVLDFAARSTQAPIGAVTRGGYAEVEIPE
jgi:hypothetical protein